MFSSPVYNKKYMSYSVAILKKCATFRKYHFIWYLLNLPISFKEQRINGQLFNLTYHLLKKPLQIYYILF